MTRPPAGWQRAQRSGAWRRAAVACAAALFWHGALAQPLPTLSAAHALREGSIEARELAALARLFEDERVARLRFLPQPAGAGASRRLIDDVRKGAIDMAVVPLGALGGDVPRFRVFEIPFLFRDARHAQSVQAFDPQEFGFLPALRPLGVEGIGWWPGEMLVLAGRRATFEPGDVRSLRTLAHAAADGEASALELMRDKLGALPSDWPRARAADGLDRGAVDLVETTATEAGALTRPRVTLTQHLYAGYVVVANPTRWSALPAAQREAIQDHLQRAHNIAAARIATEARTARSAAEARGATFFVLSAATRFAWRNALRSERLSAVAGDAFVAQVEQFNLSTTAAISRGRAAAVSWNAWFEEGPTSKPRDVEALEVNGVYRFNLDLARYAYRTEFSAGPGKPLAQLVGKSGERDLLLHPVLIGSQLVPAPGAPLRLKPLTVRLDRASPRPGDAAQLDAFDAGKLGTRALSQVVNLGGLVSWDLKAEAAGCGGIAITVWDPARVAPLDHIVVQIPVRSGGAGPKTCRLGDESKAMSAGLQTMLAEPAAQAGARVPDAALHVFESDDGTITSHAVFIHRRRLQAAQANPQATDPGVYAWQLASTLSTYVSDATQLPDLVKAAHKVAAQPGARQFVFDDVAFELAQKVFGGRNASDRAEAERARQALRDAVAGATEPSVVVRLVSSKGETLFVPFGLLAAQAARPEVSRRFTVIQPLANARPSPTACIDTWRVGRPRELQGVGGDARDLLRQAADAPAVPGIDVLGSHDALVTFLGGSQGAPPGRGDGLIVLAHHDSGFLQYNQSDRPPARIPRESITRSFPAGSAAIVVACSAAGTTAETRAIVDQLARQGVDAMIVSPFAVDAEFGTRLALEFERIVAEERAKRSGATLLDIFERSAAAVATVYRNQGAMRDMALEFMLLGNPDVRLCK
jgi:TRAP-type C4-dicarboxylate transport system substrate-binding protein